MMKSFLINTLFVSILVLCSVSAQAGSSEIHQHKSRDIGANAVPKISLSAFRDPMDGVNVHVEVQNYQLNAPDFTSTKSPLLQGHAHVFVNGIKRQRLYGNDIHIPNSWLKKGINQVAISLNSHQHENWTHKQQTIVGSIFLDLAKQPMLVHSFTSQPIEQHH